MFIWVTQIEFHFFHIFPVEKIDSYHSHAICYTIYIWYAIIKSIIWIRNNMGPRMEPWGTPHVRFGKLRFTFFFVGSFQVSTTTVRFSRNRSSSSKLKDLVNFQQTTGFHGEAIRHWAIEATRERTWLAGGMMVSNRVRWFPFSIAEMLLWGEIMKYKFLEKVKYTSL